MASRSEIQAAIDQLKAQGAVGNATTVDSPIAARIGQLLDQGQSIAQIAQSFQAETAARREERLRTPRDTDSRRGGIFGATPLHEVASRFVPSFLEAAGVGEEFTPRIRGAEREPGTGRLGGINIDFPGLDEESLSGLGGDGANAGLVQRLMEAFNLSQQEAEDLLFEEGVAGALALLDEGTFGGGGGGGGTGRFLFPEEAEQLRLQNELQRRILAGDLGFQEVRPGVFYDPLTDTLVDENQLEIDRRAQLESEAGFVRDVLANPADFLFRAALTRGQTSAVPRLTQADILNQFNQDISGARSGFGDALAGAFTPNFTGGSRFSDPRFVEAVNAQAEGLQNRLQTVDQAPASLQNRLQETFQNQLNTIGQQTGTATPGIGGFTQEGLADLSRQTAPPAVRSVISGEDPGALQLPFEVPTQAALNNLTQSESQALNTALGAEFGIGLEEAAAASRQRFQPVRSSRRARLVI